MRLPQRLLLVAAALMLCLGSPVSAATDYFMEIDGIPGESNDPFYQDWIAISQFGIGFETHVPIGPGGGGTAGQTRLKYLNFAMGPTKATAGILERLFRGQQTSRIELAISRATGEGRQEFAEWVFEDSVFTSWEQKSGDVLAETFTVLPNKVQYTYREFKPNGSVGGEFVASWDFQRATSSFITTGDIENFEFHTGTLVPEPIGMGAALAGLGLLMSGRRYNRRA